MRNLFFFLFAILQMFFHNSCSENTPVENSKNPPSSPRNLTALIDSSKAVIKEIKLIWETPSNTNGSNISQYIIYKSNNPNNLEIIGFTDGSVLSYVDTNDVSLQAFYFGVTARNEFGEGPFSNIVYVNRLTFSKPSAPRDFSCNAVDDRIVLNWSPPLNNGGSHITAYRVYKGTSLLNMQYYVSIDSSSLSYSDSLVHTNNTYYYKVTAQNFLYEGNPSETDSVTFATSKARTTVTHASPNAPNVDILVNDAVVATNVPYLASLAYTELNAGNNRIRVNVTGTSTTVIDATLPFDADKNYSIFAIDSVSKISAIRLDDDLTAPAAGKTHVRFVNLSPNAPAVDIAFAGGAVLFPNYSFKQFSAFTPINAGTYNLEMRLAGTSTVVLSLPGVTLVDGKILTVYARGFFGATGTQALGASVIANN